MSLQPPEDPPIEEAGEIPTEPLLLAAAGGRWFGIPLEAVREIVTARPFTPLPGAPAAICGVINLRGKVLTVVDLGTSLHLPRASASDDHRVVVLEQGGRAVGLAVAEVAQILRMDPSTLEPPAEGSPRGVSSVGSSEGTAYAVLDPEALLSPIMN